MSHEKCHFLELKLATLFMLPFRINSIEMKQEINWFQCSITENVLYECK
jgi:hypothetical protein